MKILVGTTIPVSSRKLNISVGYDGGGDVRNATPSRSQDLFFMQEGLIFFENLDII